jgi:hypothetical protein
VSDLDRLRLDGPWLDLEGGARVGGSSANAKFIWSPDGKPPDYLIHNSLSVSRGLRLNRCLRVTPIERIILAGYQWDYLLEAFWPPEKYRRKLAEWREIGFRCITQFDFSVFYQDPEEIRSRNLFRNFLLLKEQQDAGYKVALNFNNILAWNLSVYRKILKPPIPTMVIDANHSTHEARYLPMEMQALRFCVEELGVKDVVLWSNSARQLPMELAIPALGARVHRVPVEWTFVRLKRKGQETGERWSRLESGGE